jgi:hypothetical protein
MYFPEGYALLDLDLSDLMILTAPGDAGSAANKAERLKVGNAFVARLKALESALGGGLPLGDCCQCRAPTESAHLTPHPDS